jgi:ATP-dependent Lon protease
VGPDAEKGKIMSDAEIRAADPTATSVYPVLPLRDIVVFPHMIVPLFVGREKSIVRLKR